MQLGVVSTQPSLKDSAKVIAIHLVFQEKPVEKIFEFVMEALWANFNSDDGGDLLVLFRFEGKEMHVDLNTWTKGCELENKFLKNFFKM